MRNNNSLREGIALLLLTGMAGMPVRGQTFDAARDFDIMQKGFQEHRTADMWLNQGIINR